MALTRPSNAMLRGPLGTFANAMDPRFEIAGDGVTDDTEAIQAALDEYGDALFFPDGTYKITDTIELLDYATMVFQSHRAIIQGDIAVPLIAGKDRLTTRRFNISIYGGRFDAVDKTGGSVAIDFSNVTYGRARDVWAYNCQVGFQTGGDHGGPDGAISSYYNVFDSFINSSCSIGIRNGTLGNSNIFTNGSIKDCQVGTEDDDNTDVTYDKVAIETFTLFGSRVSNSGDASVSIRFLNNRYENPSTSGLYASATAVRVNPAAVSTRILNNYITTVANGIVDSGSDTLADGNTVP